jgi:ferredoxin
MLQKKLEGRLGTLDAEGAALVAKCREASETIAKHYEDRRFNMALVEICRLADAANEYFDRREPWKTVKTDAETTRTTLTAALNAFRIIAIYLKPVLPVYAGRVPNVSLERLAALKGSGQKAVAVVVYGNREYDDALLETKNALEANGFHVIAAAAFIAEHSIVRSVAAGRPDAQDEALCRQFAADVMAKSDDAPGIRVPGNLPYREVKPSAFHPAADDRCVKCGACAERCPAGAIPMDDPSRTVSDDCINCMCCVQVCPAHCRALPAPFLAGAAKMLSEKAAGYKAPAVFL